MFFSFVVGVFMITSNVAIAPTYNNTRKHTPVTLNRAFANK